MTCDWTIRGGTLIDSGGARVGDLAIGGGHIVRAGGTLEPGRRDLDASGRVVAPGFIDLHTHSEFAALVYPRAESKVLAGVTTDVSGNCGLSPFPLAGEFRARRVDQWRPYGLVVDWSSPAEYFARLEAAPSSVNRAVLAGHGTIRAAVVGYADRPTDAAERRAMRRLLAEALEAGAVGLSSGLIYPPGCYADVAELADLASVAAAAGGFYSSHIRDEGDALLESVDEFLDTVRRAGVRGQLSHLKASGRRNWPKMADAIARLRAARDAGLAVTADRYPYLASMTDLDSMLLPSWAVEGGREAELARLADPETRTRLAACVRERNPEADAFDRIRIAAAGDVSEAAGRTLRQWGDAQGRDPVEAAFDLISATEAQASAIKFSMDEANLRAVLAEPYVAVGSDAGLRRLPEPDETDRRSVPHPRAYGTPARFLGTYVREAGLMDWPEAIRRLTALPAEVLGARDIGRLAEGTWADVVVFDPARIADRATYEHPWTPPEGVDDVFVAGERVVSGGAHTGCTPGRVIRGRGT